MALGKISIKVFPDTSQFRENLKVALERIEKNTRGMVRIIPTIDREELAKIKAQLERLTATATVNVDADVAKAVRQLARPTTGKKAEIVADADVAKAARALMDLIRPRKATVNADADTGKAKRDLDNLSDGRKATVNADADTGLASARLAALARPRTVNITPVLNTSALASVTTALAALSGGRVLQDFGSSVKGFLTNLDTVVP